VKEAALDLDTWVQRHGRTWRQKDDEAVASLFTEGATYASHPLQPPHRGRDGIRAYWRSATADQEDLDLRFGEPVVSENGRRAAVEWWATMRDGDWAARQGAADDRLRSLKVPSWTCHRCEVTERPRGIRCSRRRYQRRGESK
jgi:hypothetical protein